MPDLDLKQLPAAWSMDRFKEEQEQVVKFIVHPELIVGYHPQVLTL
jgi:hypothetical protein